MIPFVVLTLPRSRSFWLSKFLDCPHDPSRHFRDPADVVAYFNDGASSVDTGLGMIWDTHMHAVRRDLRNGLISQRAARESYGLDLGGDHESPQQS